MYTHPYLCLLNVTWMIVSGLVGVLDNGCVPVTDQTASEKARAARLQTANELDALVRRHLTPGFQRADKGL